VAPRPRSGARRLPTGCHHRRGLAEISPHLLGPLAPTIAGTARVINGDTLDIRGQRIRLHGVDAPEHDQLYRVGELDLARQFALQGAPQRRRQESQQQPWAL